jgi:hypothetical protein
MRVSAAVLSNKEFRMSIEVNTIEELRSLLHNLWPGGRAELRKETLTSLLPYDGSSADVLHLIYEFARDASCSVLHDTDAGLLLFEKWHSPFAA